MINLKTPHGLNVRVPEIDEEDISPKFKVEQLNEVKNLIKNLKKRNIGVLITDHNVREALTIIDRAYIIHDGNVLMQGSPKDIIKNEAVKKVYLGKTFRI